MDRRLLAYYSRELQHLRTAAGEFAREFPKIAGRLSLDEIACADPYVERLLEGFAFLAARVQLKLDSEFSQFTQSLLETVYPHYLAPTPSMAVVQFQPNIADSGLAAGFTIDRGETLTAVTSREAWTACQYTTAHAVTLWPVKVTEAQYYARELGSLNLPPSDTPVRSAIRLRLETGEGMTFADLAMDELTLYLRGAEDFPVRIYEQLVGHALRVFAGPGERPPSWPDAMPTTCLERAGFSDDEALLPVGARSFQGYRLLHEYFAFPQRFLFLRLKGLGPAVRRCTGRRLDLVVTMDREDAELEGRLDASHFALHCTPAINLFRKRTDRVHLGPQFSEFHVVPDRTRPLDFEIYQVLRVTGHGVKAGEEQPFRPFYAASGLGADAAEGGAYFTVNRTPRLMSGQEKQRGRRSTYAGSEVYLSLVDAKAAPFRGDLRELAVEALCTNRDLPLQMAVGRGATDFTLSASAPVQAVRCVAGPTPPRLSRAERDTSWRLISHLTLNYLSLVDGENGRGAAALQDMLKLYGDANDPQVRKQIEGVLGVSSEPVVRRVGAQGPIAFARGLAVTLTLDEAAFEGSGVFLLGAVMEMFFSKYVSVNSFTETIVRTRERGEIMRWLPRTGLRHLL